MVRPRLLATLLLTLATGCLGDDSTGNDEPVVPTVHLYNDGTTLRVLGCSHPALLGCDTGTPMTVITDDRSVASTDAPDGEPFIDEVLSVGYELPLVVTMDAPANPLVDVALGGKRMTVDLRTPPGVDAPTTASRSQPLSLVYDAMPDAQVSAVVVETNCDGGGGGTGTLLLPEPGHVELDLGTRTGTCTHEIHIDQQTTVDGVELFTISKVTLTSTP